MFLERSKKKSNLFSNISPGKYSWLGTTQVKRYNFNCSVGKSKAQSEIYIDRGKGMDEVNKKLFNELFKDKEEIEKIFGSELLWEELPNARASRISASTNIGGWEDEDKWEKTHEDLINLSIKMESAFGQRIKNLSKFL